MLSSESMSIGGIGAGKAPRPLDVEVMEVYAQLWVATQDQDLPISFLNVFSERDGDAKLDLAKAFISRCRKNLGYSEADLSKAPIVFRWAD